MSVSSTKKYENLELIAAVRSDTILFDLPLAPKNNQYGLAVFAPESKGKYKFQTNVNRRNGELICLTATINEKLYNLFWANKTDLDYAEITYTIDGKTGQAIKMDAKNNKIIYTEAPSSDFSVQYHFVDKNGKLYE